MESQLENSHYVKYYIKRKNQNQVKRYLGKLIKRYLIMKKERIVRIIGNILLENEKK